MTPTIGTTIYFSPHLFGMPHGPCKVVQNWPGETGCVRFETRQGRCTVPWSVFNNPYITCSTSRTELFLYRFFIRHVTKINRTIGLGLFLILAMLLRNGKRK